MVENNRDVSARGQWLPPPRRLIPIAVEIRRTIR
jgi:hypothetical protein